MKAKSLNTPRRNLLRMVPSSKHAVRFPGPSGEDSCPGISKNPVDLQRRNKIYARLSAMLILSAVDTQREVYIKTLAR